MSSRVRNSLVDWRTTRLFLAGATVLTTLSSSAQAQEGVAPSAKAPPIELAPVVVSSPLKPKEPTKTLKASKAAKTGAPPASGRELPPIGVDASVNAGNSSFAQDDRPGLNLERVDTVGSRLDLTPLETPASVEVISGTTARDRGQTTVNEAVTQDATGFSSTSAAGNGGTGLATRGFAGHGSVMQLYDGTRLYVGAGTVTFPFDTWSAERIEVLRGPASVLYGEGAIGGVINVVPKKPTNYFVNEAELTLGTDFTRRIGIDSGGPISDQLAYRLNLSGTASDGWMEQEGEFSNLAPSGALRFMPTLDLSFTLSNDYGYQEPLRYWGTPLINGRIDDRVRFTNFNVSNSDICYRDNWTQFKTEWTPGNSFALRNTAYRLTSRRHWKNVEEYDFQESGPDAGLVKRFSYLEIFHDQEQFGDRLDVTVRQEMQGIKNETVVGFDVNRIDFTHTNNFEADEESFVDPFNFKPGRFINIAATPKFNTETSQYALFAEDRLALTEQIALVGGVRLERPKFERTNLQTGESFEKDFSALPWRGGAVYTPIPNLAFYGQYATGIDPLGSLITLSQANAEFDLATGRQVEVGVKQSLWGGRGEWTLAAYDIVKEKLLTQDPNNPTLSLQVGQQSSRGIEFSGALQLTESLRIDGNVAVLDAQFDRFTEDGVSYAGKVPVNVPEQVANLWLTWAFRPRWAARTGVHWVGETFSDFANEFVRPDYYLVNASVDFATTETSKLSFRVFNLLDELYATNGETYSWVLGRPRSAELAFWIKF